MSLTRSLALLRHEMRHERRELASLLQLLFIPLLMMVFLKGVSRSALVAQGYEGANGSEQVVPGMSLMFAFFMCGSVAFRIFMEHGWNTWERLRASPARPAEIVFAKTTSPWLLVVVQQMLLFGFGVVALGLHVRGSFVAVALVAGAFALPLVAMGVVLAAFCRRNQEVNLVSTLVSMIFAGLGGAFVPISSLPDAAQTVARVVPTYWGMRGYQTIVLDGGGVFDVALPVAVLVAIAAVLFAVGITRFRFDETKIAMG